MHAKNYTRRISKKEKGCSRVVILFKVQMRRTKINLKHWILQSVYWSLIVLFYNRKNLYDGIINPIGNLITRNWIGFVNFIGCTIYMYTDNED